MDTQTLTITFKGICSHYTDVVPGVRHRVVMPNASQVRMGLVTLGGVPPMAYYLLPHYVSLFTGLPRDETPLPDVEGIVRDGYIYSSARLYVANASANQEPNVDAWKGTPCIVDYVPDFKLSNEVVMGGRAVAYFDIDGGVFTALQEPPRPDGAFYTTVAIQTDGPPMLALTPFGSREFPARTVTVPVGNTLTVANADWDTTDEDRPFDFLLHYLGAERGIPEALSAPTPGLFGGVSSPLDVEKIQTALTNLGAVIASGHPSSHPAGGARCAVVLTTSCSDTKYP
jgi:hypothetical protein